MADNYKHIVRNIFQKEDDKWLYYRNDPSNKGDEVNYVPLLTKFAEEYKIRFKLELGTRPFPDPEPPVKPKPDPDPDPKPPITPPEGGGSDDQSGQG